MDTNLRKRITIVEKEVAANGISKTTGRPYTIYNYLADDGEHYRMFDDLEPGKPVDIIGEQKEWQGKTIINWKALQTGKPGSAGLVAILTQLTAIEVKIDRILSGIPR